MSLDTHQIADAFSSKRYAVTYPYMADGIKWNIIGREELVGREAVIARCAKAAQFHETVSTPFTKLEIHRAETCVVVEGAAQFQDQQNQSSSVASCDVYQVSDERLVEITSYAIELNNP